MKVASRHWELAPLRLEVAGDDQITVSAGSFDCWVVRAQGAGQRAMVSDTYWVTRGDPGTRLVVRAQEQRHSGTIREYELVKVERGA